LFAKGGILIQVAPIQLTPIPPDVLAELNRQLSLERYSVAVYYSLAGCLEGLNWSGFAAWHFRSSHEEQAHADKIFEYLADRNAPIVVEAVPAPPPCQPDLVVIFGAALEHEKRVTESLKNVAMTAMQAGDLTTFNFMQWFVLEQIEEESKVLEVLFRLQVAADDRAALLELDEEYGEAK
jgi:ferritin